MAVDVAAEPMDELERTTMKKIRMPFGRTIGYVPEHPERTARRCESGNWEAQTIFQTWPNRASMAKTIRMQEQRATEQTDWHAFQPLGPTEGYCGLSKTTEPRNLEGRKTMKNTVAVYCTGPEADTDRFGEEIPVWHVWDGDNDGEDTGWSAMCYSLMDAQDTARRRAEQLRLPLEMDAIPA